MTTSTHIEAVVVNHDTSRYVELLLRSFFARHRAHPGVRVAVTVYDNDSRDDVDQLRDYTERRSIPLLQSGFGLRTQLPSHGEVLARFVLDNPAADHFLFLDSDVCFVEDDTVHRMLDELDADPAAFGVQARLLEPGAAEPPPSTPPPRSRLHPACALVRNTGVFRSVVAELGLSLASLGWANGQQWLDTFGLTTAVMRTHGAHHLVSAASVVHFRGVSYDQDGLAEKDALRGSLLAELSATAGP
jgi:hypothetical protein